MKKFGPRHILGNLTRKYITTGTNYKNNFFYCRNNLLAIDIFYEDLNYNIIKQVPAYSLPNLLGKYTLEL